jgi:hypothetical protein
MSDAIPSTITAGESLSLSLAFARYLASAGWALRWTLQGPGTVRVAVDGTASGDAFAVELAAESSAKLLGACPWQLWASKGTQSLIIGSGVLNVRPGVAATTQDEAVLEALEAALLRLAQDDEAEVEIDHRKITFKDPEKVQRLISVYRTRIRVARGGSIFTRIPVRFPGDVGCWADPGHVQGPLTGFLGRAE